MPPLTDSSGDATAWGIVAMCLLIYGVVVPIEALILSWWTDQKRGR